MILKKQLKYVSTLLAGAVVCLLTGCGTDNTEKVLSGVGVVSDTYMDETAGEYEHIVADENSDVILEDENTILGDNEDSTTEAARRQGAVYTFNVL